jgi:hypothetical protein
MKLERKRKRIRESYKNRLLPFEQSTREKDLLSLPLFSSARRKKKKTERERETKVYRIGRSWRIRCCIDEKKKHLIAFI